MAPKQQTDWMWKVYRSMKNDLNITITYSHMNFGLETLSHAYIYNINNTDHIKSNHQLQFAPNHAIMQLNAKNDQLSACTHFSGNKLTLTWYYVWLVCFSFFLSFNDSKWRKFSNTFTTRNSWPPTKQI